MQQIKYIMNKIIILVLSLVLVSCEKKDYVEEIQWRDYISKLEYKDRKLIKLKNFKNGILHTEFFYKDGRVIDKGIEYYPNKKVMLTYSLIEKNGSYYVKTYYENGAVASEGVVDFSVNGHELSALRKDGWVYYTKKNNIYWAVMISNDGKNEFVTRETIIDTINNSVLEDYHIFPPRISKEEKDGTGKYLMFPPK